MFSKKYWLLLALLGWSVLIMAQAFEPNYEESEIPDYTLPDPLALPGAEKIKNARQWRKKGRPQTLRLFEEQVYGKAPERPADMHYELHDTDTTGLGDKAIRKQVTIYLTEGREGPKMELLLYLPRYQDKPVPVFLGLNFYGNQTIHADPGILLSTAWMRDNADFGIIDNKATEASRGVRYARWPVEKILERGYGLATVYCGDIDPDFDDSFQNGVHPLSYEEGQDYPRPGEWGTIAAWAWGLSRAMDYLITDPMVATDRVAVMGHSRLGKAALWAGAQDERFALVISNNSGCGGAALSRRRFGETVWRINTAFPHWFCDNFNQYNKNEQALPVDQHQLIALMAPRPVYVASAQDDQWADPRGEFLAAKHAEPVYQLLDAGGLDADEVPPVHEPVQSIIGYHIRTGEHDVKAYDWEMFMDFADRHMR